MHITKRQREIYDFISRFVNSRGLAPTIAEMQQHFKLKSPATVHALLAALERQGLIRRTPNISRGIEVVAQEPPGDCEIPLLGVIAAGRPIEAILSNETLCVPRDMLTRGRTFALRVRGDSMTGEQIRDGDFIIVESRQTADNGQTVVALVDGSEATVKRFYEEPGQVRLEAANPRYKPLIIAPPDRVRIQGVVMAVLRKYAH